LKDEELSWIDQKRENYEQDSIPTNVKEISDRLTTFDNFLPVSALEAGGK